MKDIIYKTNGEVIETSPKNGKNYTYEELREIVGGFIQIIFLKDKFMIINEEGKLNNLPYNDNATVLYRTNFKNTTDFIVGDALLCGKDRII